MPDIHKEIERDVVNAARVLKPHLQTQMVIHDDSGEKHDEKRVKKTVVMDGTEKTFEISTKNAFSDPGNVQVTLSPESTVAMWGKMVGANKFKITAASSLTNIKIIVLMRGY